MDNIYKNNIVYLQEIILLSICLLQGVDIQSVMNWTKNEVIEPKNGSKKRLGSRFDKIFQGDS